MRNYSHAVGPLSAFEHDTRKDIWTTWVVNYTVPGKVPELQSLAADGSAGAWHRLSLSHTALPKQFLETLWEEARTEVHLRSTCGHLLWKTGGLVEQAWAVLCQLAAASESTLRSFNLI